MKNPFIIDADRQKSIKHREVASFSRDRVIGTEVPWIFPETDSIRMHTDEKRVHWLFFLGIVVFSILLYRTASLQIASGDQYRLWAEQNRIRIQSVIAPRGIIFDRMNKELVKNIPNFQLLLIPADLPRGADQLADVINNLTPYSGLSSDDLENLIGNADSSSYQPLLIREHVPHDEAVVIEIATRDIPGVHTEITASREYVYDDQLAHVLGYTGKLTEKEYESVLSEGAQYELNEVTGKSGIEKSYENILRGINGKREVEVDALGKVQRLITDSPPTPGNNLTLTIDAALQSELSRRISEQLAHLPNSTGAAAVVLDPRSGSILALASQPSYSSNAFITGQSDEEYQDLINDPKNPLFFRTISGEYPSGSVIKPIIAAAALEEGIVNSKTTFLSTGGVSVGPWFFPDWKAGGHGVTDVKKAIAESVNTFFYLVGGGDNVTTTGLGVERIREYGERFGLSHPLGIDLLGEASGFLPSKQWKEDTKGEPWYIGDTYHLSIGQGDLLVTPLQVASYTATIANGGTLYQPYLVNEVKDSTGRIISQHAKKILSSGFVSPANIQIVREGMRSGVTSGSSQQLASLPFTTAGKTGTAQFGADSKTHAWFTAFAPYENPEIVITVLVEAGGEGHAAALPIAKEILSWWYENARL
ncbi:MAG: penicillin-binding protein 2 [Candidatus Kerfeldbacteria bacterium RIFCSPLOWO2_01_FULL_48_11]|uniref:Penicillin-binding protein 2 n=1 Tax=Candidatus Kerfeldbacteria bacterium RIFCSPLOWO2_01_FULL_48_11 TaxID=1798543 RepID=A0A1G2B0U3_9BACT|nr:MAG: Peptidoglycan glycosyltransferase [Parcubacteria group bacterium GW2011_GWA2_48_9]KKW16219.1 MAG: Peptidoglycan glycosyltransferase [Parcubacteria group bacterium GW2011_GWC2_49_9]OGY82784.1 MAG: penicillin-binding protein 2 [Candidatus Kerfeldbacteria bacterium RIFCSPLOWO2_01_FULL_48_11]HCM67766.1 penicillin-binding protein 2 [Candidatus Kerfeldbacteria bacterium]